MGLRWLKCRACDKRFEILERHNGTIRIEDDAPTSACTCGAEDAESLVGVPMGIELGDASSVGKFYPRFDRGLQCTVNSKQHRAEIMRRRGLVALEGCDIDPTRELREAYRKDDESEAAYRAQAERFSRDPDFADARQHLARRGISWTT